MDYTRIVEMIESDCQFLREKKIIDYSLLIGIYEKEKALSNKAAPVKLLSLKFFFFELFQILKKVGF